MKNSELDFLVTKKVATILARQFYSGWTYKQKCDMNWEEYKDKSLLNWLNSAKGIVNLIKTPAKFKDLLK